MYKIENTNIYTVYCKKEFKYKIGSFYYQRSVEFKEDTVQIICKNFKDVLKYFANYYFHRKCKIDFILDELTNCIWFSGSYISMCYVINQFGQKIFLTPYRYDILKLVEKNDLQFQDEVTNYQKSPIYLTNHLPYIPSNYEATYKKTLERSYEFRKTPVPHTGRIWKSSGHGIKIYQRTKFEVDREELDEMCVDYYVPIQKNRKTKRLIAHDWSYDPEQKSWKDTSKCRKQWMKHKKGCKPYNKRKYDIENIEEEIE